MVYNSNFPFGVFNFLVSSQVLEVLLSIGHRRDDSRVARLEGSWLGVEVFVCAHELSLIVGASVPDDDLGRILVRHDHGRLGKSASERVGVVRLQGLLQHACVQVVSDFVLVLRQRCNFGKSLLVQVDWLRGPVTKS